MRRFINAAVDFLVGGSLLLLFVGSVFLTFQGKPFALVSFFGFLVTSWSLLFALGVGFRRDKPHTPVSVVLAIAMGFGLFSLGRWLITAGSFVAVTFAPLDLTVALTNLGVLLGIAYGLDQVVFPIRD